MARGEESAQRRHVAARGQLEVLLLAAHGLGGGGECQEADAHAAILAAPGARPYWK